MSDFNFGHLKDAILHASGVWIALWIGLALLTVALLVLMRTSWGQSNPLKKCAALSLLAHLLLAGYATTVQIVTGGSKHDAPFSISLVDGPPGTESGGSADVATGDSGPKWDNFLSPSAQPDVKLDRALPELPPNLMHAADLSPSHVAVAAPTVSAPLPATTSLPIERITPHKPLNEAAPVEQPVQVAPATPASTFGPPQVASTSPLDHPPTAAPRSGNEGEPGSKSVAGELIGPLPGIPEPPSGLAPDALLAKRGDAPAKAVSAEPVGGPTNAAAPETAPNVAASPAATKPGELPAIYKDRVADESDKIKIIQSRGGSAAGESAVQAGLKWLCLVQSADGHWDPARYGAGQAVGPDGQDRRGAGAKAETGITGMALLALLGAGNTHLKGDHAVNVQHGLEYLCSVQGANGNLGGNAEMFSFMYCHGIATLALSEAYAMTGDQRLEKPLRNALNYTLAAQSSTTGGWRYQPHDPGDTSQLGWQLMALKSAELSGIAIPARTRDGMTKFLKSVASGSSGGLASYRPGERPTRTMSAEALVCREFLGIAQPASSDEAAEMVLGDLPDADHPNVYYWYYGTLAMYQLQGERWQRWSEALQTALVKQQETSGDSKGSWKPDPVWGGYGGRVYSTAMSGLCLEVYYRYLPLYGGQRQNDTLSAKPGGASGTKAFER